MTATEFTPVASLLGGTMIGLAAVALMAVSGRIAGVSGIAARLLPPYADTGLGGRLAFILGIVAAPLLVGLARGSVPVPQIEAAAAELLAAGLLVGFGAVWGNGCTSGHGVCGLSSLSARSMVATGMFMATEAATVLVNSHLI